MSSSERPHWLPAPHFFALNQACAFVNQALDGYGFGCFLVGSSLKRRDYRDVDVRYVMEDASYDRLFRNPPNAGSCTGSYYNALWSLMCLSISRWLSESTGLPVDFQIQRQTQANAEHPKRRNALGVFLDYPGERPTDLLVPVVGPPE